MTTDETMRACLDHLLALPENKDGMSAQIVTGAAVIAGALKPGPVPGTYNLLAVSEEKGTKKKVMINILLPASEIRQIHTMVPENLVQPVGGSGILAP